MRPYDLTDKWGPSADSTLPSTASFHPRSRWDKSQTKPEGPLSPNHTTHLSSPSKNHHSVTLPCSASREIAKEAAPTAKLCGDGVHVHADVLLGPAGHHRVALQVHPALLPRGPAAHRRPGRGAAPRRAAQVAAGVLPPHPPPRGAPPRGHRPGLRRRRLPRHHARGARRAAAAPRAARGAPRQAPLPPGAALRQVRLRGGVQRVQGAPRAAACRVRRRRRLPRRRGLGRGVVGDRPP